MTPGESVLHKKVLTLLSALIAVVTIAACGEKLDAGRSCPLLCPQQAISLADTTIDAVDVDTTVLGLPPIGNEAFLMLASHGDTLETRAIVRFDTLPQSYTKNTIDSVITHIDSAILVTPIAKPDSLKRPKAPVTIEAYNVDTTDTDTSAVILGSLFRPDRFLGSKTFAPESLLDTLRIPISTDSVLSRVKNGTRLRVGFRVLSSIGVDIRIGTSQTNGPVTLRIRASTHTGAAPVVVPPNSSTPPGQTFVSGPLEDFTIVLKGQTTTAPAIVSVGGVPSRRTYIRFNVPSRIVDSTTIVRASLLMTQAPNRQVDPRDSLFVNVHAILSSPVVTDLASALQFLSAPGSFGLDSISAAPADSGLRSFEIVGLVRTWRGQPTTASPRSIALLSAVEGQLPGQIDFFSTRAPLAVRPRLRITYVPQTSYGLP
jgi:predicted small lipoprotein YifL